MYRLFKHFYSIAKGGVLNLSCFCNGLALEWPTESLMCQFSFGTLQASATAVPKETHIILNHERNHDGDRRKLIVPQYILNRPCVYVIVLLSVRWHTRYGRMMKRASLASLIERNGLSHLKRC